MPALGARGCASRKVCSGRGFRPVTARPEILQHRTSYLFRGLDSRHVSEGQPRSPPRSSPLLSLVWPRPHGPGQGWRRPPAALGVVRPCMQVSGACRTATGEEFARLAWPRAPERTGPVSSPSTCVSPPSHTGNWARGRRVSRGAGWECRLRNLAPSPTRAWHPNPGAARDLRPAARAAALRHLGPVERPRRGT